MFIQTEETPNPETLKFIPGKELLAEGTLEYKNKKEASSFKLAKGFFDSGHVTNVFVGKDFITITKSSEVDWEVLKPSILSVMLEFFAAGGKINEKDLKQKGKNIKYNYSKKDLDIVNKIKDLIDERIKPAVAQDGGDINFVKLEKGIVFLELRGACSGCPSSAITLKSGIENMLKYYIPEIKQLKQ